MLKTGTGWKVFLCMMLAASLVVGASSCKKNVPGEEPVAAVKQTEETPTEATPATPVEEAKPETAAEPEQITDAAAVEAAAAAPAGDETLGTPGPGMAPLRLNCPSPCLWERPRTSMFRI